MKTDRLLGLLSILANTEKITVQELAERFEVSKRTIFRDLDTLSCAGIPIVSYPGIGGGVSVVEGYKLKNQILTKDDMQKIFTALNGLKSIDNNESTTNLIAKLVPEKETIVFSQSDYVLDLSSWFNDSITHKKIAKLHQAITQQKCVRLEYVSKKSRIVRIIEPHKLIFKQSYWYVYAFCQKADDFRLFKLGRIVSLEILETEFQMRPISGIEFADSFGENLFSETKQPGMVEVILEYDTFNEFALTDKIDASFFEQDKNAKEGKGCIHFYTNNLTWTADYILRIADMVKVISPPELFLEVQKRIEKLSIHYER